MTEKEIIKTNSTQNSVPTQATKMDELPPSPATESQSLSPVVIVLIALGAIVLIAGLIFGAIYLVNHEETAATVRDIFIILVALEFMLIGFVIVLLVIQLAKLVNMLQNEVKPMIDSTNEAVNTIRGTSIFVSENLSEPIIKLNSLVAGLSQVTSIFTKKGKRKE